MAVSRNSSASNPDSIAALVADTRGVFQERFSRLPVWTVAAPGRVDLIGGHTDYNDGFVLPMAIERYVVMAAAPLVANADQEPAPEKNVVTFYSADLDDSSSLSLDGPTEPGEPRTTGSHWSNYLEGVVAGFRRRGHRIPPLQVVIQSSVPFGGGLSSSAALEVAAATLLEAVLGVSLDADEKALLCQEAEHRFAGVPCGILDQLSSIAGREGCLLLLDCRSRSIDWVPFSSPEISVLITNTGVKHQLAGGEYATRRQQCETAARGLGVVALRDATLPLLEARRENLDAVSFRRARHVLTENERTLRVAQAIRQHDWQAAGTRMYESHESLRKDYEVSCSELDLLVELTREVGRDGGVYGSRMAGGGFGGCTVTLLETTAIANVTEHLQTRYAAKTGIQATFIASRPARGAFRVEG